jgi:hypothetical protein
MVQIQHWKNPTTPSMLVVWAKQEQATGIKTIAASIVFCTSIALPNIVTYWIYRQTWLLTNSAMRENSWMLFCTQPELIPAWLSPMFLSLWVLKSVLSCDKSYKELYADLLANKREKADVWAKWINKTLARGNPQLEGWMYMSPLMHVPWVVHALKKLVSSN